MSAIVVFKTLEEVNQSFLRCSLKLALLKNCAHTIPLLADWMYEEWLSYDQGLTKEKLIEGFKRRLNDDTGRFHENFLIEHII